MARTIALSAICLYFYFSVECLGSQSRSNAEYQTELLKEWRNYSGLLDEIRPQIFSQLPKQEAEIVNSVEWRVEKDVQKDQFVLPASFIDEGGKVTSIGQGFIRQLFLFIETEIYGEMYGKQAEVEAFLTQVLGQIWTIYREKSGGPSTHIATAREHFNWDQTTLTLVDQKAEEALNVNLAFITAHEAAHHVLGHTARNYSSQSSQEKLSREEAADRWASETLIASGHIPAAAAMSLMFLERLYDVGMDPSHPTNGCRSRALITNSINAVDRLRPQLEAKGANVAAIKLKYTLLQKHLDESGSCPGAVSSEPSQRSSRQAGDPKDSEVLSQVFAAAARGDFSKIRGTIYTDAEIRRWKASLILPFAESCSVQFNKENQHEWYSCDLGTFEAEESAREHVRGIVSFLLEDCRECERGRVSDRSSSRMRFHVEYILAPQSVKIGVGYWTSSDGKSSADLNVFPPRSRE